MFEREKNCTPRACVLHPLPPSPPAVVPCPQCGADRAYEFTLLPTLVARVQPCAPPFGVVAAYVCSQSCMPTAHPTGAVVKETVLAQPPV